VRKSVTGTKFAVKSGQSIGVLNLEPVTDFRIIHSNFATETNN
jgi:hypothetical protein